MARLQLSKSSLARQAKDLRTFQRFLPSLDLKRQQLMAERAKAVKALEEARAGIDGFRKEVGQKLPMLANMNVDLTDLAKLSKVELGMENVVGTQLRQLG